MKRRWDIFCRVVDNFGDIGVCWRLSKQLAYEYKIDVQLWVDDLQVASKIIPNLDASIQSQSIHSVKICRWEDSTSTFDDMSPADVVIETFACQLPPAYLKAMTHTKPIWINLEYLSAEAWVNDCHRQPSIDPKTGLKKTFFFPGFNPRTGGLIRERNLSETRDAAIAIMTNLPTLQVSLFCYPDAPIKDLLSAMSQGNRLVECFVPIGTYQNEIAAFFNLSALNIGDVLNQGQLKLIVLPFLTQDEYDQLLWCCDLNFVRGEDSWIRALWATKPFIWQPYRQADNLHLEKLEAFLNIYLEANSAQILAKFNRAWSGDEITLSLWNSLMTEIRALGTLTAQRTQHFESQTDLASQLVVFTENEV
jgi:uncharacterized repeat protein (TIGR03837 family)